MSLFSWRRRRAQRVYGGLDQRSWRLNRKSRSRTRWLWQFLKLGAVFGGVAFIGLVMALAWIGRDLPDPNKLSERPVAQSTKIYDRTGTHLLYEVFQDQKRTLVTLDQIAPAAINATIAVEDKHFYDHKGVRIISILRAAFNNLIGRRTGSGGASTLTQQLIKNTVVGSERTLWRKIKEAIVALRLEREYSKDEILQLYLNEVPYGSTNYGIEAASQSYFKKNAKDLTLAEGATLAALTKAPSYYLNNPDALRDRRDLVLRLMFEQGYITESDRTTAAGQALRLYSGIVLKEAPHFVLYIKQLLADRFGERTVDTGGLKVITTLDYDKQQAAEKIIAEQGAKFAKEAQANNAALVAVDPATGQILALVGSRDYHNDEIDGQFNVAVLGRRQPGSSFKPFVYTLAFEQGYTPETVVYDVVTDFELRDNAERYRPHNYDGKARGLVTFRKALQGSLNIPAVKVLYLVGPDNAIEFARRFGYTTFGNSEQYGLSLVLGGAEVNLLEHTNAYAALANNGVYHPPVGILRITNGAGEVLEEWKTSDGTEAIKPELAALITSVLTDDGARAFIFGARGNLTLPDRPVAAKTGTTNDTKDAWTMGYVPQLAVGVWVGNTTPAPMKGGGNKLAAVIWNQFMRAALTSTPPQVFPLPPPRDPDLKPVLRGTDGGIKLPINKLTGFIATSSTPDVLIEERAYLPPHDILHYVRGGDPRGPPPDNPAEDPQYANWESALAVWVELEQLAGRPVILSEPPTTYDSATSSPELAPTVQITSPVNGQVLVSREFDITVAAQAPRGVIQVTYQLDGVTLGTSTIFPFITHVVLRRVTPGRHTLRAMAIDDQGNSGFQDISVDLEAPAEPPSIEWLDLSPLTLAPGDFPREMHLVPFGWEESRELKIYLKSGSEEKLIYTFTAPTDKPVNNRLSFPWKRRPGAGAFTLRAELTDRENQVSESLLEVEVAP